MRKLAFGVPAVFIFLILLFLFLTAESTGITLDPAPAAIGTATPVRVKLDNPHGVRSVTAEIEQDGNRHKVFEQTWPARRFLVFGQNGEPRDVTMTIGKKQAPALKEGKAKLIVSAVSNDLRAATTTATHDVSIITRPPSVAADGFQHYINQGGSELVTFTVSGYWTEAGVRVGPYTFRSWPMPGESDPNSPRRFSLFAFPYDVSADTVPVVYARNPAGAEAKATFWNKVTPKQWRKRELPLDDAFLQKVVTELDPEGSGDLLQRYLKINRDMRKANNSALRELRHKTVPQVLWRGPFFRIGQVESFFADERSYIYKGQKVDQQMHLGFDLSDVQASPVKAANIGRVIFAGPLGIYGQCVVLDHGYGVQSIYGHMRQIDVKEGDTVQKEQVIGRSGATGLAGGDHIHFSMQVDGVQVNPLEWWDDHWIQDRVLAKLPGAVK